MSSRRHASTTTTTTTSDIGHRGSLVLGDYLVKCNSLYKTLIDTEISKETSKCAGKILSTIKGGKYVQARFTLLAVINLSGTLRENIAYRTQHLIGLPSGGFGFVLQVG